MTSDAELFAHERYGCSLADLLGDLDAEYHDRPSPPAEPSYAPEPPPAGRVLSMRARHEHGAPFRMSLIYTALSGDAVSVARLTDKEVDVALQLGRARRHGVDQLAELFHVAPNRVRTVTHRPVPSEARTA